jgi:hypothetical protein
MDQPKEEDINSFQQDPESAALTPSQEPPEESCSERIIGWMGVRKLALLIIGAMYVSEIITMSVRSKLGNSSGYREVQTDSILYCTIVQAVINVFLAVSTFCCFGDDLRHLEKKATLASFCGFSVLPPCV